MTGRRFLEVAERLALGSTEAEWRSAISRTYYAAFHVAREVLDDLRFVVPRAERAHSGVPEPEASIMSCTYTAG